MSEARVVRTISNFELDKCVGRSTGFVEVEMVCEAEAVPDLADPIRMSITNKEDHLWYPILKRPQWTNTTAAAATADLPAPATNKRRLCHNCGKSHTGASSPLRRTCGRRHLADKPCRTGTRRRPAPRQLPTVVNNYTFNGDGHAITISAHPSSAGAVPPPAKRQKRRKRPNKAKEKVEEKKEEEREKDAEPAEEVEKPSTELCLNEYPPRRPKTTKNNEAG
ncbi:hypothetical protein IFM61606_00351 [Aspergillus udagawae]|nr:hypothetical protein IFM61606_00351 [Aspergillus udagawae]